MTGPRTLAAIVVGILGILGLTVVIVVLAGQRTQVQYAPDSPEAVVQSYLRAWEAGDMSAAYALFSTSVQLRTDFSAYQRGADEYRRYADAPDGRRNSVFVTGSHGSGVRIIVELVVEEIVGQGLGLEAYRYGRSIVLVRESGSWKLDEALVGLDANPLAAEPY